MALQLSHEGLMRPETSLVWGLCGLCAVVHINDLDAAARSGQGSSTQYIHRPDEPIQKVDQSAKQANPPGRVPKDCEEGDSRVWKTIQ